MKTKLAILGVSGVGKDYVVNVFKKDYEFVRLSFSDQLKRLAAQIYPWLDEDYPPEKKEVPLDLIIEETGEIITDTPRQIWLKLNKLREVENDIFIRMLAKQYSLVCVDNYIISDVRTQNEYEWCKENEFTFILVKNDEASHPENSFDDWVRGFEEKGLYDYVFDNSEKGVVNIKRFIESCFIDQTLS